MAMLHNLPKKPMIFAYDHFLLSLSLLSRGWGGGLILRMTTRRCILGLWNLFGMYIGSQEVKQSFLL